MTQQCANGHDNPDGARFCGKCGAALGAPPAAPEPPEPPETSTGAPDDAEPSTRRPLLVIAAVVVGIVAVVVVVLVLTSGGSSNESSKSTPSDRRRSSPTVVPTAPPTAATTPAGTGTTSLPAVTIGDKVTYPDGATIQVLTYEQPVPPDRFFEADPGNELAVIDAEFCASPTDETSYNPLGFALEMADERRFPAMSGGVREPRLNSGDLPAGGGCKRGWVLLQAPVGERPDYVVWDYPGYVESKWAVPAE